MKPQIRNDLGLFCLCVARPRAACVAPDAAWLRVYSFKNYQFDGVNTFVEVLGGGGVPYAMVADMAFYDRIEVLRGASGLVTGMGDPSGAINMVRKKPTAEFQGSAEAGLGSWATSAA